MEILHKQPPITIHKDLYDFLHEQNPPTLTNIKNEFPFLLDDFITETLKCFETIPAYTHPPINNYTPPNPQIPFTSQQNTTFISWNVATLNTALPNIKNLLNNYNTPPTIISLQETKITTTKSTKYIENLFPNHKLIFNNTHLSTNLIHQRRTHIPRGGLLTLVHKNYAFPGNLTKIPTPHNISPYLQIIQINNQPLQSWLLLHLYMPTNEDDIRLIPELQTNITSNIQKYPNHIHILYGDFNRDIAFIGRKKG